MKKVMTAAPFVSDGLGPGKGTSRMLVRQFLFPDAYDEFLDRHFQCDHDYVMDLKPENAGRCFLEHTGRNEEWLLDWFLSATDEQVLGFMIDILEADRNVRWSGYRVLGSIHPQRGFIVFTLELFFKHPDSDTGVRTIRAPVNAVGDSV